MKKKILVTGAGGYIGRHVVTKLCDFGAEVIAVDFHTEGIDPRAKILNSDIFSGSESIYEDLGSPDACLHMAWKDGFVHNSPSHIQMLPKHYEFLEILIKGGIKQIAVMGTMHEVGYFEGAIDENSPCNPSSLYGISKNALRQASFLLAKQNGICMQWLRAYYIYGDDSRSNSIFAKLTKAEQEGKEKFPFTTGKNKYDFIHVDTLAEQLARSVLQTEVDGIINCCTGSPVSLADKVNEFIKEHNFKIRLEYGAFPDRPYDSPAVWGNADKINKIMNG